MGKLLLQGRDALRGRPPLYHSPVSRPIKNEEGNCASRKDPYQGIASAMPPNVDNFLNGFSRRSIPPRHPPQIKKAASTGRPKQNVKND
jgi:hypothetical protein